GKDATGPAWSIPRITCCAATATSNSTRCGRAWWSILRTIRARATAPMRWAARIRWCSRIRVIWHWSGTTIHAAPSIAHWRHVASSRPKSRRSGARWEPSAHWVATTSVRTSSAGLGDAWPQAGPAALGSKSQNRGQSAISRSRAFGHPRGVSTKLHSDPGFWLAALRPLLNPVPEPVDLVVPVGDHLDVVRHAATCAADDDLAPPGFLRADGGGLQDGVAEPVEGGVQLLVDQVHAADGDRGGGCRAHRR